MTLNVVWAHSLCDAAILRRFLVIRAPHFYPRADTHGSSWGCSLGFVVVAAGTGIHPASSCSQAWVSSCRIHPMSRCSRRWLGKLFGFRHHPAPSSHCDIASSSSRPGVGSTPQADAHDGGWACSSGFIIVPPLRPGPVVTLHHGQE
jgi:hypothetical protein